MDLTIFMIGVMIFAVIIATYLYAFKDIGSKHYANYISTLTLIGTAIAAIIFIYQYEQAKKQERTDKKREVAQELQNYWVELEKMFMDHYPYLTRLYQQIYPSDTPLQGTSIMLSEEQMKTRKFFEIHMCTILFQTIENIYLLDFKGGDFTDSHNIAWINKWRSWFKSPIVREQWSYRKQYIGQDTQNFIENYLLH